MTLSGEPSRINSLFSNRNVFFCFICRVVRVGFVRRFKWMNVYFHPRLIALSVNVDSIEVGLQNKTFMADENLKVSTLKNYFLFFFHSAYVLSLTLLVSS